MFDSNVERRLYHLRHHIKTSFSTSPATFHDLVFRNLRRKKLCYLRVVPMPKAWRIRKKIQREVEFINTHFNNLLDKAPPLLDEKMEKLGSHVLLLDEEHLERLGQDISLLT